MEVSLEVAVPGGGTLEVSVSGADRYLVFRIDQVALEDGCADGTNDDVFDNTMVGCAGRVSYANRSSLCASGWHACSAEEWVGTRRGHVPSPARAGRGKTFASLAQL